MKLEAGESWRELLRRVFAAEQESLPHRRYPAGRLQRRLGARGRRSSRRPSTTTTSTSTRVWPDEEGIEVSQPRMFEYTNFTLMANFDLAPGGGRTGAAAELRLGAGGGGAGRVAGGLLPAGPRGPGRRAPRPSALEADLLGRRAEPRCWRRSTPREVSWPDEGPGEETLLSAFERQARRDARGRGGDRRRRPDAELSRVGRALQPGGPLAARAGRGARTRWWACWPSVRRR